MKATPYRIEARRSLREFIYRWRSLRRRHPRLAHVLDAVLARRIGWFRAHRLYRQMRYSRDELARPRAERARPAPPWFRYVRRVPEACRAEA